MEFKPKFINDTGKFYKTVGVSLLTLLIVFELIVIVQFMETIRRFDWRVAVLLICGVTLIILCAAEVFWIKNLKARIAVYVADFFMLLAICALTGSTYLAALYCIILSTLYINVNDFKPKLVALLISCVSFTVTCVAGWFLNTMRLVTYDDIVSIVSGCLTGIIIIGIHFMVENFLLSFYRTNKRLTEALKDADESRSQLEVAYAQLSETAVYEERNRIARDIHDNAGHSMTAVIMQTEAAKLLIDTNPKEAKQKIISANIQAKNALEQMRDSVHLLAGRNAARPLKEELEEILTQTREGTDINIRSDIEEVTLSPEKRRFIANSLKELISNGLRHGGATAFYVEFTCSGGKARLTVSDNGAGMPEDFKEGFGLKGIREKALSFGGSILIESEENDGCEITIDIALDEEEKND